MTNLTLEERRAVMITEMRIMGMHPQWAEAFTIHPATEYQLMAMDQLRVNMERDLEHTMAIMTAPPFGVTP